VLGHSVLRLLLLCHVPQAIVGNNSLDGIIFFRIILPDLWVHTRASHFFISSELVNGEADVWRCILAWCGGLRVWLHCPCFC
jgi:hypothetical protein